MDFWIGCVFLGLLSSLNITWGLDDVPEFQYPCYVDVCTFPSQYCNSEQRRCSPCTRSVCRQDPTSVPLACRYTCIKNNQIKTTKTPTTTILATNCPSATKSEDATLQSLNYLMMYSVLVTTLFVCILIIFITSYACHKWRRGKTKKQKMEYQRRACSPEEQQTLTPPPSYRTNDLELGLVPAQTASGRYSFDNGKCSSSTDTPQISRESSSPQITTPTLHLPINATHDTDPTQHQMPWVQHVDHATQEIVLNQSNSLARRHRAEITPQTSAFICVENSTGAALSGGGVPTETSRGFHNIATGTSEISILEACADNGATNASSMDHETTAKTTAAGIQ